MTREQRKGIKKDEKPRMKKEPQWGRRKGRHSKKDKYKNKQKRIWGW